MASSTMASAAAQPIQIRVLAASTGATYPISLHPNELRCVFLSFLLLLVCFVFRLAGIWPSLSKGHIAVHGVALGNAGSKPRRWILYLSTSS